MNYQESLKILEEIKKVKKILINCHKNPDPDSVGSALAMTRFVKSLGKEIRVICPTKVNNRLGFIEDFELIEQSVDFNNVNYENYDLFIVLDSSSWDFASKMEGEDLPKIKMINMDHHATNRMFGFINLVDKSLIATAELLYMFFEDCGFEIDKKVHNNFLWELSATLGFTGSRELRPGLWKLPLS